MKKNLKLTELNKSEMHRVFGGKTSSCQCATCSCTCTCPCSSQGEWENNHNIQKDSTKDNKVDNDLISVNNGQVPSKQM